MIRGIIAGHGNFARAMLETVEGILGRQRDVVVLSNANISCDSLCEKIKESMKDAKEKIIFVDLPGGSCAIACMNLMKKDKNMYILCGVNLPMLMEFFLLREKYSASELVSLLIKKAKENIIQLEVKNGNNR